MRRKIIYIILVIITLLGFGIAETYGRRQLTYDLAYNYYADLFGNVYRRTPRSYSWAPGPELPDWFPFFRDSVMSRVNANSFKEVGALRAGDMFRTNDSVTILRDKNYVIIDGNIIKGGDAGSLKLLSGRPDGAPYAEDKYAEDKNNIYILSKDGYSIEIFRK